MKKRLRVQISFVFSLGLVLSACTYENSRYCDESQSGCTTDEPPAVTPTSCARDEDCAAAAYCQSAQCVPRCRRDSECAAGEICLACGKCQKPGPAPASCGGAARRDYCANDSDCGTSKRCDQGRCFFRCDTEQACPVGQLCAAGTCAEDRTPTKARCQLSRDCNSGSCINGYCHAACTEGSPCGPLEVCQLGICQPNFAPAP